MARSKIESPESLRVRRWGVLRRDEEHRLRPMLEDLQDNDGYYRCLEREDKATRTFVTSLILDEVFRSYRVYRLSVIQLGFRGSVKPRSIARAAARFGLELCPGNVLIWHLGRQLETDVRHCVVMQQKAQGGEPIVVLLGDSPLIGPFIRLRNENEQLRLDHWVILCRPV